MILMIIVMTDNDKEQEEDTQLIIVMRDNAHNSNSNDKEWYRYQGEITLSESAFNEKVKSFPKDPFSVTDHTGDESP